MPLSSYEKSFQLNIGVTLFCQPWQCLFCGLGLFFIISWYWLDECYKLCCTILQSDHSLSRQGSLQFSVSIRDKLFVKMSCKSINFFICVGKLYGICSKDLKAVY